jgi:uncharacterized protein YecE (DUF72 family)
VPQPRPELRIGTSGYQYDHWSGVFYPSDLPKNEWFPFFARHFDTVEINNTFYHLPQASTFDSWRDRAPPGFCYVLKFSRYGTHLKHLKDPADSIGRFLDRAERLGPFLGPILVQLRPNWRVNVDRLADFLDAAPGRRRWALEFRDPSWLCPAVYNLLREHNAALCVHDLIRDHPRVVTADWVYLRFHGAGDGGDYSHQALAGAARRIRRHLDEGREVFAYFNNDAKGYALANAADLRRYLDAD